MIKLINLLFLNVKKILFKVLYIRNKKHKSSKPKNHIENDYFHLILLYIEMTILTNHFNVGDYFLLTKCTVENYFKISIA